MLCCLTRLLQVILPSHLQHDPFVLFLSAHSLIASYQGF